MDRQESGTFVAGAVLITIGGALMLDRMGILPWTSHWSVWPLLLIGYGVFRLASAPHRARGLFPIFLGVWLWAAEAGLIEFSTSWPLIFVLLGIAVMWQTWAAPADVTPLEPRRRDRRAPLVAFGVIAAILAASSIDGRRYLALDGRSYFGKDSATADSGEKLHVMAALGQAQRNVSATAPFKGGEVGTFMGETDIDLRNAVLPDGQDAEIEVFAMMGSVIIRVPDAWVVDVRAVPVMGEIVDRRGMPEPAPRRRARGRGDDWVTDSQNQVSGTPTAPTAPAQPAAPSEPGSPRPRLVISGSVMMGSVVIRS